ncbi:MAG: hypothetical protein HY718_08745, partial [Planctomycetes bacterium]|nr:hypothetical protein [Planctomycetota bacterium]
MGTISSSTGLISGIDIASLVTQLMQIEARPLDVLKTRITNTQNQQAAYEDLRARLLAFLPAVTRLSQPAAFTVRSATSSQPSVATATAASNAPLGTYSFLVKSVVSTHQMASLGFTDRDATPVGEGTLTFEAAAGRVDPDTELGTLNGGAGVRRGQIRITDRSGASAMIDLRAAYTVGDVL